MRDTGVAGGTEVPLLDNRRRNETLIILCVEAAVMMTGMGLISPVLPQYARSFGVSITMVGLLISAFGVARMAVDVPAGRVTDRVGRRPILIGGPLILALGSVACGLAGSYWELLAFRLVQGIGSAMYTTTANVMLADISMPGNRGRVMGLYQSCLLLGAGLGPTVGGFVAQYFGLRVPFFGLAFFAGLAALWAYLRLPETRPVPLARTSRVALTTAGNPAPPPDASRAGLGPLFRNLDFLLIAMVALAIFFIRSGAQNQLLPLLGKDRMGLTEGQIGVALTVVLMVQFLTMFLGSRLSDRFGRKAVITPGCLIAAASLVMLAETRSYSFLLVSCVVMGLGIGITAPTLAAYAADVVPRENHGSSMGLYRAGGDLGFVIGPILLGWLADMRGFGLALVFNSLFLFLIALLFQGLSRERRGHRDAAT